VTLREWLDANADLDRIDLEWLLRDALGIARGRILAAPDAGIPDRARARLEAWTARRRAGEPVAYITGRRGFWDFELDVTPAVLIPRPETELLVEVARERVPDGGSVLDLGTGSGAIAIAVSRSTRAVITAAEVCPRALAVARANAERLGARVRWVESDWFAALSGRWHVIVSNPPYIREHDPHLPALRHEPRQALAAGRDGLDAIRRIVADAPVHLHPGGWLALEHGCDQAAAVRTQMGSHGFVEIRTRHDLSGLERVTEGRKP
jgi:release factor glutamine methyltransferase